MNRKIKLVPETWKVIVGGRFVGTITAVGPGSDPWWDADPDAVDQPTSGDFASRRAAIEALVESAQVSA